MPNGKRKLLSAKKIQHSHHFNNYSIYIQIKQFEEYTYRFHKSKVYEATTCSLIDAHSNGIKA